VNAVEIEEAISQLATQPYNKRRFCNNIKLREAVGLQKRMAVRRGTTTSHPQKMPKPFKSVEQHAFSVYYFGQQHPPRQ
jgi:hypothetical protein